MSELMKNPRHLTKEDIELIALRWARYRNYLNNRNVNCFIAGLELAHQWLVDNLAQFLEEEGRFYLKDYAPQRISDLGYSGIPLNLEHSREFGAAEKVGELLTEAARVMKDNKILK